MDRDGVLKPERLPIVVVALVVPTVIAALIGGVGLGAAIAAVVMIAIVVVAARSGPEEPIPSPASTGASRRVLLVLSEPVKDPGSAHRIFTLAAGRDKRPLEILALAPTQPHFLDRWASDVRAANAEAREKLAVTVETLEHEDLQPRAEIGDSDFVLAVEDALNAFEAEEVILATGSTDDDPVGTDAADHLRARLHVPFDHLVTPA